MPIVTVKQENLEYLVARGIGAPHAFTTRLGGVSTGHLSSLNLGLHRGQNADDPENVAKNQGIMANALGFDPKKLVLSHQVHSDITRRVTAADALGIDHHLYPECDGLITNDPGTALLIFTADCTPILLHDPVTGAVGAVHAGWRGTAADIAGKAVRAMCEQLDCKAENICAAIGPNIGFCCFETDAEVPDAMVKAFGAEASKFIRPMGEKFYVNLKEINALALTRAGVQNIEISAECTMCSHDRFWSHRYTRGLRGSQGAIIVCREVRP